LATATGTKTCQGSRAVLALKARIEVADPAALRQITGHIFKFTGLFARRAHLGRVRLRKRETALAAFPIGLVFGTVHNVTLL
jgi:hypothetical protein